jgi:PAS domain S-box-containing protein
LRALLAGRQIEEAGSIAEALEAVTRSAIGCIVISFTPCCSDTVDLLSRLPRAHPGRSVDMPVVVIVPSDVTEEQMRDIIKNGAEEIIRESDLSARTLSFAMDKAALVSSASQQQSALDRGYLHTSENTSQLRSSELQLIYERASIGMCVLDRQLRYVRINGCLAEMNGVAIDQHIGQTIREVVPDLADTLEPLIENVFLSGKPSLNVEVSGRTKGAPSQTRTWVESWSPLYDKYNQVVAVSGLIEEITRHRRSEREAAFLASIVTSSQDAIISKDLNGIITSWNRAAETLLGYKAEEMIGRHIAVLIPSAHLKEENEIIRKIRSGEIIDHFETVRRRKDGTLIDVFLTISPLRDPREYRRRIENSPGYYRTKSHRARLA